ncbi:MAG: molybdenum cofactor biosynthesis protein MoaE [Solirubrobacteraceae bacterium]
MNVEIRLFAMLRERASTGRIEVELADGATVAQVLERLEESGPLAGLIGRLPVRMAVNRELASPDTVLSQDDELALIPPVSGGAPATVAVRIRDEPLVIDALARCVRRDEAGALVIFCGITRQVASLDYEAYREMAEHQLELIAVDCAAQHALAAIAIEHRVGNVPLGEPSVIVAAAAAHRDEAFAGAREAIDRVKAEAAIWKREIEADGTARWVDGQAQL